MASDDATDGSATFGENEIPDKYILGGMIRVPLDELSDFLRDNGLRIAGGSPDNCRFERVE